jgi:hypothetical protein
VDTLGLYQEALHLASDLGYEVREEPLGDLPGGRCTVKGTTHVLLNLERPVAERLERLLESLAVDERVAAEPMSRLLAARLRALAPPSAP